MALNVVDVPDVDSKAVDVDPRVDVRECLPDGNGNFILVHAGIQRNRGRSGRHARPTGSLQRRTRGRCYRRSRRQSHSVLVHIGRHKVGARSDQRSVDGVKRQRSAYAIDVHRRSVQVGQQRGAQRICHQRVAHRRSKGIVDGYAVVVVAVGHQGNAGCVNDMDRGPDPECCTSSKKRIERVHRIIGGDDLVVVCLDLSNRGIRAYEGERDSVHQNTVIVLFRSVRSEESKAATERLINSASDIHDSPIGCCPSKALSSVNGIRGQSCQYIRSRGTGSVDIEGVRRQEPARSCRVRKGVAKDGKGLHLKIRDGGTA